jgi:hypothetical protein
LSIGGLRGRRFVTDPGLDALAGVLRSSSARSRSINGTERCERRRATTRALQQAVERFADATATKRFPSSRCVSAIQIVRPLESTVDRNRAGSRLLFFAKFLEARIIPERIEHRIEPEQRRSERHAHAISPIPLPSLRLLNV